MRFKRHIGWLLARLIRREIKVFIDILLQNVCCCSSVGRRSQCRARRVIDARGTGEHMRCVRKKWWIPHRAKMWHWQDNEYNEEKPAMIENWHIKRRTRRCLRDALKVSPFNFEKKRKKKRNNTKKRQLYSSPRATGTVHWNALLHHAWFELDLTRWKRGRWRKSRRERETERNQEKESHHQRRPKIKGTDYLRIVARRHPLRQSSLAAPRRDSIGAAREKQGANSICTPRLANSKDRVPSISRRMTMRREKQCIVLRCATESLQH